MKCDKCLTCIPEEYFVSYAFSAGNDLEKVNLCFQCNKIYDNGRYLLAEFLKEDFGKFPIGNIDRGMIEARKLRALKKGPWETSEIM